MGNDVCCLGSKRKDVVEGLKSKRTKHNSTYAVVMLTQFMFSFFLGISMFMVSYPSVFYAVAGMTVYLASSYLVGWLDAGFVTIPDIVIHHVVRARYFKIRDLGYAFLAALMAFLGMLIAASVALAYFGTAVIGQRIPGDLNASMAFLIMGQFLLQTIFLLITGLVKLRGAMITDSVADVETMLTNSSYSDEQKKEIRDSGVALAGPRASRAIQFLVAPLTFFGMVGVTMFVTDGGGVPLDMFFAVPLAIVCNSNCPAKGSRWWYSIVASVVSAVLASLLLWGFRALYQWHYRQTLSVMKAYRGGSAIETDTTSMLNSTGEPANSQYYDIHSRRNV